MQKYWERETNFNFIFFQKVKKAPFCDVTHNINTSHTSNFGSPFQLNQPDTSVVIKNIFNCIKLTLLTTK